MLFRPIWLAFGLMVLLAAVTLSVAFAFPNPSANWLSRPGVGDGNEAQQYYIAISAPATFDAWKTAYGFSGSNDVEAIYYNAGDLGFGREMHCRKNGSGSNYTVACYVVNHGLGAATPVEPALTAAIANQNNLPTVAMVYSRTLDNLANDVAFYIYDPSGNRLDGVALDSEGDKFTPRMCLACHGGTYDSFTNSVYNANFLPFDVASFQYSQQAGYTLAAQQEKFRQLNALVKDAYPTPQITELIDGWYAGAGGVNTPGSTFDGNFVPSGYVSDPGLYNNFFKPYCRSCHVAQLGYPLSAPDQLLAWNVANNLNAGYDVFHVFDMPHAELTSHNFWSSPAPAYLADRGGWSYRVTKVADTNDGVCDADCSLREAIIAANTFGGTAPVYKSIITFAVDGTFTLTRSGANEDLASTGDLDINGGEIIILGNGADKTIIEGGGLDRVFHILNGAIVVIQGVTIQNGNTAGSTDQYGAGLTNDGSQLTLNNSVVKNNAGSSGAGIMNLNGGITEINDSTIGPNNVAAVSGGGLINNGGTVTLNNSTISGNSASLGGGIYNVNAGSVTTVNQSTITRNSASSASNGGGGVRNIADSIFNVKDSLIAGNLSPGFKDCANSAPVTFTSQGYNLFGENGSANGCPTTGTDIVLAGSISTVLNINLSAAGSDGTSHHALVQNGPAVDAIPLGGNCSLPSYDQRNAARPEDGNLNGTPACDIGAYELVPRWLIFLPLAVKGQ